MIVPTWCKVVAVKDGGFIVFVMGSASDMMDQHRLGQPVMASTTLQEALEYVRSKMERVLMELQPSDQDGSHETIT